ncbi:hypothetical protein JD969_14575 [Planctomycetota bacterium]|nr:hypothetical protein JD969_14575 [Planctomycetota bacterium]
MFNNKTTKCALIAASLTFISSTTYADAFYSESEFNADDITINDTLTFNKIFPGTKYTANVTPVFSFEHGGMITQSFTIKKAAGQTNTVLRPIWVNDFVYDPQTQGSIEHLSASIKTFNNTSVNPGQLNHRYANLLIKQDDRMYYTNLGNIINLDDPLAIQTSTNIQESNFFEVGLGFSDPASHPDFSGSEIQFGFTYRVLDGLLQNNIDYIYSFGLDNASIRISSTPIPEPASMLLLGAPALLLLRRKH